jgi:polygalacturonase
MHRIDSENNGASLKRREWLGRLALPTAGAVMGAGLLRRESLAAPPARASTANDLRGGRVYNVRVYGAKGDGATLDTAAVQPAVDACHGDGGGTVLVPAGTFVIGAVELRSNVMLHIAAAGKLMGSADGKQYHAVDAIPLQGDHTLGDGNWALLFAVNAKNLSIEGPGTINGQGAQFHAAVRGSTLCDTQSFQ